MVAWRGSCFVMTKMVFPTTRLIGPLKNVVNWHLKCHCPGFESAVRPNPRFSRSCTTNPGIMITPSHDGRTLMGLQKGTFNVQGQPGMKYSLGLFSSRVMMNSFGQSFIVVVPGFNYLRWGDGNINHLQVNDGLVPTPNFKDLGVVFLRDL